MKKKNTYLSVLITICSVILFSCNTDGETKEVIIEEAINPPSIILTKGNSWVVGDIASNEEIITEDGIRNWKDLDTKIRTYFKVNTSGQIKVSLKAQAVEGSSVVTIALGDQQKEVEISNTDFQTLEAGMFSVEKAGYYFLEIQGKSNTGETIADIDSFTLEGSALNEGITYVKEDFYWGRRGPSVHLNYTAPEGKDIVWFYNEITVPEGDDTLGSYFMANGFAEGYFGMQVNSSTERRILFSVWSPYETQNPDEIPDDYKIILLGKGEGVTTGEFGNEGSGGQSYKVFNWKAGQTYKFLLKGSPSTNNSTDYTAYFFDPTEGSWNLIASFRRPHTSTYLKRQHSFLENFITQTGNISRMGIYGNQWVYDTEGEWHELTEAKFTADATAKKGSRVDYAGGAKGNTFYMKNCGFFDDMTEMNTMHTRTPNGKAPEIDFALLPKGSLK
ncbi:protein of unknown function (DUF3472) [Galbibacter orientalis DSM 19592]|uniref:DUF5077 domain-containing protein n=1 Tax=Galbibacter orientalis DSM 19592 TaxID=926559 RepID=I3CB09_9FLAO|nr:DUF3472 domain-containing protein [Galbibacter orientalis]EIJ40802.1 protein of unknown function (DUF3472) [Galbibacter orientalis DSM 19592]